MASNSIFQIFQNNISDPFLYYYHLQMFIHVLHCFKFAKFSLFRDLNHSAEEENDERLSFVLETPPECELLPPIQVIDLTLEHLFPEIYCTIPC